VVGIPEVLEGSIEEMVNDARMFEKMGVDGINLLAYRYVGDPDKLMREVIKSVNIDVIVAGSINSFDRIRKVVVAGARLYTIGSAIFERNFVPSGGISDQIKAILEFEKTVT
jgi:putative N-acetylmannosamine-6-phosphate epimerase